MQYVTRRTVKRVAWGVGVAAAMFAGLGTVAALWENPLFTRMTPTGGFEIALLFLLSALLGLYVGLPQAECGKRTAGTGGIIGFLGIACPVCNKILMLLFGSALLIEYYEPVRLYLALGGVVLVAVAIWLKLTGRGCAETGAPVSGVTSP
ncbi:MAG: hypothetical protein HYY78_03025 [Betaproteobacteria bacterium]|nr:hypothetical protein [Betaproteobacteria bacterium]